MSCSRGNPGFKSFKSVSFVVDPENNKRQKRITISAGDWVLGAVERFDSKDEMVVDSDAAFVGEVLQVIDPL